MEFEQAPKKDWDKMKNEIASNILSTNNQVLETSLNSWLSKIEIQINQIEAKVVLHSDLA